MIKDMTRGNPSRLIINFALPVLVGNLFQQLYSVVDTAIVGRGVGVNALAGVGSTGSLNWFIMGFIFGFTHGFSIKISQSFGSKDEKLTRKTVVMSLYLAMIISVLVSVLSAVFARPMLTWMGTPTDIIDSAVLYITIIFSGAWTIIFYNITSAILRALGNSTTPLISLLCCSGVNVVLDILFVIVFKWGVAGAAIATVIANIISGLVCFVAVLRIPMLKMTKEDLKWNKRIARDLIRLGLPVGLMNSVTAIGTIALQFVVNSFGSAIVAAFTLGSKLVLIADNCVNVVGTAVATYVGQNYGAGDIPRTKLGVRKGFFIALGLSAILAAIMTVFGKNLLALFVSAGETAVIGDAYTYVFVCSCMIWSLGMLFVYRSALQGMGDTIVPMFSGFLELGLRIGVVFLLPKSFGFYRISFAEVSAWLGAALMLFAAYLIRMRRKNQ
ncbi:MAG: MATE family efflux transporter [Clostridia bacterium]|nr:MATE family efflux transporter [Clostridia bacterium]